jgi:hypothetical protein
MLDFRFLILEAGAVKQRAPAEFAGAQVNKLILTILKQSSLNKCCLWFL